MPALHKAFRRQFQLGDSKVITSVSFSALADIARENSLVLCRHGGIANPVVDGERVKMCLADVLALKGAAYNNVLAQLGRTHIHLWVSCEPAQSFTAIHSTS